MFEEMSNPSQKPNAWITQLRALLKPKNLVRTVASQVPLASAATEMMAQIETHQADQRLETIEAELKQLQAVKAAERMAPAVAPDLNDWGKTVREYSRRVIDFVVFYDGGFHSRAQRGRELFNIVAHGCIIGDHEVLTCKEAVEMARGVAEAKYGRVNAIVGMDRYDVDIGIVDGASGLAVCRLEHVNEDERKEHVKLLRRYGLDQSEGMITTPVKVAASPWMGQEVGFIHSGEAENVMRDLGSFSRRQFDVSVISHFRLPEDGAIKTFVTGVLPGRVVYTGTPFFARNGTLLGILSDCEHYKSDAGRRGVGRTLLGHPRFMNELIRETRAKNI